jgi:hypothetical protein
VCDADISSRGRAAKFCILCFKIKRRADQRTCSLNPKRKEKKKQWNREHYRKERNEVIKLLGGKCVCCGENQLEFLAIDHINNDGNAERKMMDLKTMVSRIYRGILPLKRYQILCANCNHAKAYYGGCPHKQNIRSIDRKKKDAIMEIERKTT